MGGPGITSIQKQDIMQEQIKEIIIQQSNVSSPKNWNKHGKSGRFWNVSVQINDQWYNGTIWNEAELEEFEALPIQKKTPLVLYDEEFNGNIYKKFRFPKPIELHELRLKKLEKFANIICRKFPEIKAELLNEADQ